MIVGVIESRSIEFHMGLSSERCFTARSARSAVERAHPFGRVVILDLGELFEVARVIVLGSAGTWKVRVSR